MATERNRWANRTRPVGGPRGSLILSVLAAIVAALVVATGAGWLGVHYLPLLSPPPNTLTTANLIEVIKISLASVAGVGGVVALVVAYRKQSVSESEHSVVLDRSESDKRRELNERFASAVEQLGNNGSAAIRMGGVYSLVKLADESHEERQRCVDVLCSYLRIGVEDAANLASDGPVRQAIASEMLDFSNSSFAGGRFDFVSLPRRWW